MEKPKTGRKSFMDLTKEEMEARLARATKQAQEDLHANGLPYIIGNVKGTYAVYPDGKRIFMPSRNTVDDER
jgi:hypothetical protein